MSQHKYKEAYNEGFKAGKDFAMKEFLMHDIDYMSREEIAEMLINKYGVSFPFIFDIDAMKGDIKASSLGRWYVGDMNGKHEEVVLMDAVMEIIDSYVGKEAGNG